jgi:Carboxypeptidase regulatory-like domain
MIRVCCFLLLLFSLFSVVLAQAVIGSFTVTGNVVDQNDALLSGAQVMTRGGQRKDTRSTRTDAAGAFRFENVGTGDYELEVTREGFKPETVRISVGARQPTSLRVALMVAELQQEIAVTETNSHVNTDSNGNLDVNTANRQALDTLPSLSNDYIGTMSRFLSDAAVGTGGVTLVVDGVEMGKAGVSASAIQELKINNNPYSAEYSRPGRGPIEIITKPGAQQYHGTFNFLFRDQHLNARDPFALTRPPEQRRIYEGNFTGPLVESKAHPVTFLITANREEEDLQSIVFATGPQGDVRQNFPNPGRNTEFSARVQRQMSDKSILSVLYSYQDRAVKNQGVGGFNLSEVATNFEFREDLVRIAHSWIISPKLVSQFNLLLGRYVAPTVSVNDAQRIVVQDAFTGGGAQADFKRTEEHWAAYEIITYTQGKHLVKAGIQVPDFSHRGVYDKRTISGRSTSPRFRITNSNAHTRSFSSRGGRASDSGKWCWAGSYRTRSACGPTCRSQSGCVTTGRIISTTTITTSRRAFRLPTHRAMGERPWSAAASARSTTAPALGRSAMSYALTDNACASTLSPALGRRAARARRHHSFHGAVRRRRRTAVAARPDADSRLHWDAWR